ncbi:chromate transport protein ChrA [Hephaestia caeni]|jgi:chromate transporter|uniref:Chromate transport protein ChrA n=1 Tax=Hephaestia caeni TaxID=645617 RepID=A0A397NV32_9SPHN|nr:chromate transporter [Hephaestia caeni]RIA37271.1 chromate transport protein ChrA [Hephaestia caeni]
MENLESPPSKPPSLAEIAYVSVRYGNFTLGGGSAGVAVMYREIFHKRHWLTNDQFNLVFILARLAPGTNLFAFGTGVGWTLRGIPGAVIALLAGSIPCSLIIFAATALFRDLQHNPWAQPAIHGAIAAAVSITVKAGWEIAHSQLHGRAKPRVVIIAITAFVLYTFFCVPAFDVLLLAALTGAVVTRDTDEFI